MTVSSVKCGVMLFHVNKPRSHVRSILLNAIQLGSTLTFSIHAYAIITSSGSLRLTIGAISYPSQRDVKRTPHVRPHFRFNTLWCRLWGTLHTKSKSIQDSQEPSERYRWFLLLPDELWLASIVDRHSSTYLTGGPDYAVNFRIFNLDPSRPWNSPSLPPFFFSKTCHTSLFRLP